MVKSMRSRMRTKRRNKGKSKKLQYKRNKTIGRSKKGKKKRSKRARKIIHKGGTLFGNRRPNVARSERLGGEPVDIGKTAPGNWTKVGERQGGMKPPSPDAHEIFLRNLPEEEAKKIENCYPKDKDETRKECGLKPDSEHTTTSTGLSWFGSGLPPQMLGWSNYNNEVNKGGVNYCCRNPRHVNSKEISNSEILLYNEDHNKQILTLKYVPHVVYNDIYKDEHAGTPYAVFKNGRGGYIYINMNTGLTHEKDPGGITEEIVKRWWHKPRDYPGNMEEEILYYTVE
jgi:hypothetical protein